MSIQSELSRDMKPLFGSNEKETGPRGYLFINFQASPGNRQSWLGYKDFANTQGRIPWARAAGLENLAANPLKSDHV